MAALVESWRMLREPQRHITHHKSHEPFLHQYHRINAVLSRCDQFELSATNEEVIASMRSIASEGFRGLTPDDCSMVIDYIEQHSSDHQVSMQLLGPSLRKLLDARQELMD